MASTKTNRPVSQCQRVGRWLRGYPADEFAPPGGGMVIGHVDGVPVTGGAFRRFDDRTAELKRIWTDSAHRRRGHGRATLAVLESWRTFAATTEIPRFASDEGRAATGERRERAHDSVRLAYEAGVLSVLLPALPRNERPNIIVGASVGAINGTYIAAAVV